MYHNTITQADLTAAQEAAIEAMQRTHDAECFLKNARIVEAEARAHFAYTTLLSQGLAAGRTLIYIQQSPVRGLVATRFLIVAFNEKRVTIKQILKTGKFSSIVRTLSMAGFVDYDGRVTKVRIEDDEKGAK